MTENQLEDQVRRVFERQGAALDAASLAPRVETPQEMATVEHLAAGRRPRGLFLAAAAVAAIAVGSVTFLAAQSAPQEAETASSDVRYPNAMTQSGTGPVAGEDHWHHAYTINHCGQDLPVTDQFAAAGGIHTHGGGLIHIHPFDETASEQNATLGLYFESQGAVLTDDSFSTGPFNETAVNMSEAEGCDGSPAVLQLAIWTDPFDPNAEPIVHTENLASAYFDVDNAAITLALLPAGAEIPKPPQDRLGMLQDLQAEPPAGVLPGEPVQIQPGQPSADLPSGEELEGSSPEN